jgi:AI-2 transport protein TqsA
VNEPLDNPASSRTDTVESLATTLPRPSFLRVLLVLAATVVVLAGMHLSAPILNPILFALVLSLLFSPAYSWLKRRGLPTPLALLVMLVGLAILFAGLFAILTVSIGRFTERVGF